MEKVRNLREISTDFSAKLQHWPPGKNWCWWKGRLLWLRLSTPTWPISFSIIVRLSAHRLPGCIVICRWQWQREAELQENGWWLLPWEEEQLRPFLAPKIPKIERIQLLLQHEKLYTTASSHHNPPTTTSSHSPSMPLHGTNSASTLKQKQILLFFARQSASACVSLMIMIPTCTSFLNSLSLHPPNQWPCAGCCLSLWYSPSAHATDFSQNLTSFSCIIVSFPSYSLTPQNKFEAKPLRGPSHSANTGMLLCWLLALL